MNAVGWGRRLAGPGSRRLRLTSTALVGALVAAVLIAPAVAAHATPAAVPVYLDDSGRYTFEERAADLVSRMTLGEKVDQLRAQREIQEYAPPIARLGVRGYPYWGEALHGIARANLALTDDHYARATYYDTLGNRVQPLSDIGTDGLATDFPNGLGLASSWDRDLVHSATTAISDEARAYLNIRDKGLTYWSPTVNLDRDPRWGRADETYGEDPYLTAEIGGAFVTGLQGENPNYLKAIATPKHFFGNNSEINRHVGSSNITDRALREYYTAQFAPLVSTYGAKSLMAAYNAVDGVPNSANSFALDTLARRTWGFNGFVTSDCSAIKDINWGFHYTPDPQHEVATALKAGTDIDCTSSLANARPTPTSSTADYPTYLSAQGTDAKIKGIQDGAVEQGLASEANIDIALVRIFTQRFATGEFDSPGKNPWPASQYNTSQLASDQHLATAQQASDESVVLLKNTSQHGAGTLPLKVPAGGNVVVLGYMANDPYSGAKYSPFKVTGVNSALTAIKDEVAKAAPGANVTYINGLQNQAWSFGDLPDPATNVASRNGTRVYLVKPDLGVNGTAVQFEGGDGAALRTIATNDITDYLGWPGRAPYNDRAASLTGVASWLGYFAVNADIPAGTTTVRLYEGGTRQTGTTAYSGTSIVDPGGYFEVHLGSATGPVVAAHVPAAGQTVTFPYSGPTGTQKLYFQYKNDSYTVEDFATGHTAQPASAHSDADLIRNADAVVVYVGTREGEAREEEDRANVDLPRYQDRLVDQVAQLNPRTVAYIQSVEQVNVNAFQHDAGAILWTSYNGQYQGDAAARILFGEVNPSGHLPFTWYRNVNQLAKIQDYTLTPSVDGDGRTYQYFDGDVAYPFGYGLSYSKFTYSNLQLNRSAISPNDTLTATVDVRNTSNTPGKTVVQLYASSPHADGVNRPKSQLKGFTKVDLAPGQTEHVKISLKASDLWFWDDAAGRETFDQGRWTLRVGPSSAEGPRASFTLAGGLRPAITTVAAIPDGVVLNTATPENIIHANLSAARNDQTFYDLTKVNVHYRSSNPGVARVDAAGTVSPAGPGVANITATVNADGTTKSTSFPVVVYSGARTGDGVTLFQHLVQLSDRTVTVDDAARGIQLSASMVPAADDATYTYSAAYAETNTAQANITPNGVLTATRPGVVRVTVVADQAGQKYTHTATVTVTPMRQ
jgi:beta-glucosidase